MAIHGIGSDLIRVSRLAAVLGRHGDRFATRILAPEEQGDYARATDRAAFLAKRFAAKEAAAKALGTGIRDGLRLAHFAIGHDALGRPTLSLLKRAAELADAAGIIATHLSISDEGGWAQAFVVFEREVRSGRS
ncbi:MAG: holo-ACP synthase [Gammaproteobacteria bacterium]|nr:MAG: holo-ACP synthase [Gammaproteobacteria bacterium]